MVSFEDNFHKMSTLFSGGNKKKIFQNVICLNVYPAESIIILTSSLVVKMLTVSVSTISNSQVFLVKKSVGCFGSCSKLTTSLINVSLKL